VGTGLDLADPNPNLLELEGARSREDELLLLLLRACARLLEHLIDPVDVGDSWLGLGC
jgi:hypothetical protein